MKFTKKPVTIDAVQWNKDGDHPNVVELPKKVRDTIDERTTALGVDALRWIGTLEGGHIVCKGDWIITGVQGEQYPCKPDIFALTYDAAPIPPTEVEPATEYAEYILDHYDRKSRKDRKLLGKHLAEWADRRYRDAAPIPPNDVLNCPTAQIYRQSISTQTRDVRDTYIELLEQAIPAAPIPPTDEIVEIKRQRDSAVGSLEWIHNATKTGASIDVICGYAKGALQEVGLAAPIPSIKITNEMAYAFHRAITDSDLGSDDVAEIKKGLAAALANYAVPIPPTVTTQSVDCASQI